MREELQAQGHVARAAFGGHAGKLPGGFEEALRTGDWRALDWWFVRVPELVNRVPAAQRNQLAWIPLARVLTPGFMPDTEQQRATIAYLLARGANPWQKLPHEPYPRSVVSLARELKSPLLAMLDPPASAAAPALAATPALPVTTAGPVSTAAALDSATP